MDNVYEENGYANRMDYLSCMSEDYGIPLHMVLSLAEMLGECEDFDGLVTTLDEYDSVLDCV